MSGGLENIREQMVDYLNERGVQAFAAWPAGERPVQEGALVVVSLRGCQAGPAGFQDYLGERYDERTGLWQELYGRRAALTFGLDLYAPRGQGDEGIQAAFEQVVQAFAQGSPQGLAVQEVACGETVYDSQARRMKRNAQVVCHAYLYAVAQPGGLFTDFELRGGIKP